MKYGVIRTDTADSLIRKIVLHIAENFGTDVALEKLDNLESDDLFTKEHLGLTNVRYTLNLIYQRNDLLRITNKEEGGARIEMLIPQQENEDETVNMR